MHDTALPPPAELLATPLVWTAADGRIAGANPAFCRWLGVSVRRLLGQPLASLESQGDDLAERLRTLHPQSIQAYVVQLRVIATDTTSADFEIVTNIADGDALVKALRKDRALWVLSSFFAFTTHLGGAYVRMQAFKPGHDQTIAPVSSGALSAALSMLHVGAVSTYVVITATV